jgi:hypothetical protein
MNATIDLKMVQLHRKDGADHMYLHAVVDFGNTAFVHAGYCVKQLDTVLGVQEVILYVKHEPGLPQIALPHPITYLIHFGLVTPTNATMLPLRVYLQDAQENRFGEARWTNSDTANIDGGTILQQEADNDSKPIIFQ